MSAKLGFWALIFISNTVLANTNCMELSEDLKAMQAAQKQLIQSLSQKNEVMASTLDRTADKLERNSSQRKNIKKSDSKSLRIVAKAFRGHEKRESALVARFERASAELLDQVQVCLTQKTTAKN